MRRAQRRTGAFNSLLPIRDMIATAIDQAVRHRRTAADRPDPPFTGTLILRGPSPRARFSTSGPNDALPGISSASLALQWSDDGGSAAPVHCQTVLPAGSGRLL